MKKQLWIKILFIILIVLGSIIIDMPNGPNIKLGNWHREIKVHLGLDLQGGTHMVYELDMSKIESEDFDDAAQSVVDVIEKRVNVLGVSEPIVQSAKISGKYNIIVELPGIKDIEQAQEMIGKTAQLEFWELSDNQNEIEDFFADQENTVSPGWIKSNLDGSHLRKSRVDFDQTTGNPHIAINFNNQGKEIFANITQKNIGKPLAIALDQEIISAPTVQSSITDGSAIITGDFTIEEAKNLSQLLNAGALPVPINIVEQRTIGATLGEESVKQSLLAGFIGILLVIIFMIIVYKIPGFIASIALIIYGLIILALFKLIPVTLTLAGIAGFIISFGMAVDANVLIFSRMKEEFQKKLPTQAVIKNGFDRAFTSIFDSNISTLITCIILYMMTSGLVRGFAITLGIGVLVSMFSAIFITKNLILVFANTKMEKYIKI
jgi:protein-export membrane protein SecD